MSRVLTLEVSDELYAAMEEAAMDKSRSVDEIGVIGLQSLFLASPASHANGQTSKENSTISSEEMPQETPDFQEDDPFARFIGVVDNRGFHDWGANHDYYIGQHLLSESRNEEE